MENFSLFEFYRSWLRQVFISPSSIFFLFGFGVLEFFSSTSPVQAFGGSVARDVRAWTCSQLVPVEAYHLSSLGSLTTLCFMEYFFSVCLVCPKKGPLGE